MVLRICRVATCDVSPAFQRRVETHAESSASRSDRARTGHVQLAYEFKLMRSLRDAGRCVFAVFPALKRWAKVVLSLRDKHLAATFSKGTTSKGVSEGMPAEECLTSRQSTPTSMAIRFAREAT